MTVLISDSFNRTANATSLGMTDSYSGGTNIAWTVLGTAVYGIDANGCAYCSAKASSGHGVVYVDAGNKDGSITANIQSVTTDFPKLAFRIVDGENFHFVEYDRSSNQLVLRKYVAGSGSTIASKTSVGLSVNDVIKITNNGTAITVFLNGTQVISATDITNQTATKWGFNSYNYTNARFDNFIVEDLATGTVPKDASVTFNGLGQLNANGQVTKNSSADLKGIGSLSSSSLTIKDASASLLGQGIFTSSQIVIKNAQASLVGLGVLTANASGISIITGSTSILGQGKLDTSGQREQLSSSSLLGQGILSSTGKREALGSISIIGQGVFEIQTGNVTIITAGASLLGTGKIIADAFKLINGSVDVRGKGVFDANGKRITNADVSLLTTGQLIADGYKIVIAEASLMASGKLQILDGEPIIGSIRLKGQRVLNIILGGQQVLNIQLKGQRQLNVILKGSVGVTAKNQNFTMTAGDSFQPVFLCSELKYNSDTKKMEEVPIDFTGCSFKWVLKKAVDSAETLVSKAVGTGITVQGDTILIQLDKADTENLGNPYPYYHECEMTDPLGHPSTLFTGRVTIEVSGV